jgi:hypothetical protein
MTKTRGSKVSKSQKDTKDTSSREENHKEKRVEKTPVSTLSTPSMTSVPSPASTSSDEEQEQARGRTEREIQAIQRIYRATGSMEKTADFFGVSVSTVHRYCSGIVVPPEVRDQLAQTTGSANGDAETSPLSGAESDDEHGGSNEVENLRAPRLSYEISANPPRVYEPDGKTDRLAQAPRMIANSNDDWTEIVCQIRAAAWNARYRGNAADFYSDRILPDLEIADVAKTLAGSNDPDFVREALSIVWKKAVAYDRIQHDAGLSSGREQLQQKPSPLGAFQN